MAKNDHLILQAEITDESNKLTELWKVKKTTTPFLVFTQHVIRCKLKIAAF